MSASLNYSNTFHLIMRTTPRKLPRLLSLFTLSLGLLLLILWFASGFFGLAYGFTGSRQLTLVCGCLDYYHQDMMFMSGFPTGMEFIRLASPGWRSGFEPSGSTWHIFSFSLIWLALPLTICGILFTYRTRPRPPWLCMNCKYDLSGLPSNTLCPECGRPPSQSL